MCRQGKIAADRVLAAYLISRRVPATGRRGLVVTVDSADGKVPGTIVPLSQRGFAVEQAMVCAPDQLSSAELLPSGPKKRCPLEKRGVLEEECDATWER